MLIKAARESIYECFVEPDRLTRFWLASASGPLSVGKTVDWAFLVAGATARAAATQLVPGTRVAWRWSDGSTVTIDLRAVGLATAVTVTNQDFTGSIDEQIAAALDATEGFAIVLCDLKTLLESGTSAGLTRAKAVLIETTR
jgi:uncharacterized protein YndB with AHSA1/START domain